MNQQTSDIPEWLRSNPPTPDLSEAARLLAAGMHLVPLAPFTKQPLGEAWNAPANRVTAIDPAATGYGLPLAANGLASIDPDNVKHAAKGFAALGFDLEELMQAGARTGSTRPGSGGRATFKAPVGLILTWLKFGSRVAGFGTILELRATSPNLQDCVPGIVYRDKSGNLCTQRYANEHRLDNAPELPAKLAAWWHRCSTDIAFLHEQQKIFFAAIGAAPILTISGTDSSGKITLAHRSQKHAQAFNRAHSVPEILARHGYTQHRDRWACPTATGQPAIREIPGKDGLWKSDHASDVLSGTFDAWIAFVELDHGGDLAAAQAAADREQAALTDGMFPAVPVTDAPTAPTGQLVQTIGQFTAGLKPPHWLWAGIFEKGRVYALVGRPGEGKSTIAATIAMHAAKGATLHGRAMGKGRVLAMCGEDAFSARLRFDLMLRESGMDPDTPDVHFTSQPLDLDGRGLDQLISAAPGDFDLVFVDTLAAHSSADSEDDNRAAHMMAAALQSLSTRLGDACVVALAHPAKGAQRESLLPRGGSGFTGGIDGVVCLWREPGSNLVELFSHSGKYRGQQFSGIMFELVPSTHPTILDNFGQPARTVLARERGAGVTPISNGKTNNDAKISEYLRGQCAAGVFLSMNQMREIDIEGVRNVRARVRKMVKDGVLVALDVPRVLTGGRGKQCLFVAGEGYKAMLNRALTIAESPALVDVADQLVPLVERLRLEVNGQTPELSTLFKEKGA